MKNREIIAQVAIQIGMYTEEEVNRMIEQEEDIPLHTITGWKQIGRYRIKDKEEGIETKLWRRKEDGKGFYLAKSFLYRLEQLEQEQ